MRRIFASLAFIAGVSASAALSATQVWGGPFGLEMGLTADELRSAIPDIKKTTEFTYVFTKAPKHYPGTNAYIATLGSSGLCRVAAISVVESSSFGDQVKKEFNNTSEAISGKYGTPTDSHDSLRYGSIWSEPRHWMMGLSKRERNLVNFWIKENDKNGQLNLPSDLNSISLEATAKTTRRANVVLTYDFSNIGVCIDEINANSVDAL